MAEFIRQVDSVFHVMEPRSSAREYDLTACGVVFGGPYGRPKKTEVIDYLPAEYVRCGRRGCLEQYRKIAARNGGSDG